MAPFSDYPSQIMEAAIEVRFFVFYKIFSTRVTSLARKNSEKIAFTAQEIYAAANNTFKIML